jgi:hypothetical protein
LLKKWLPSKTGWQFSRQDEELDAVGILQGEEDTKDAVLTAFLIMDWDGWVWALHSISIANLKGCTKSIHGIIFGFAGDLQDLGNGTWTLLTMADLHPLMMLSINQCKTAPQKAYALVWQKTLFASKPCVAPIFLCDCSINLSNNE